MRLPGIYISSDKLAFVQYAVLLAAAAINTISFLLLDLHGLPFMDLGYSNERSYLPVIKLTLGLITFLFVGLVLSSINNRLTNNTVPTEQVPISPHQKYQITLQKSGKRYEDMLKDWHDYYYRLSQKEKREVWAEYINSYRRLQLNSN